MNVAIIGCGSIARERHAREYALNKNVKLVGFFDYVLSRAEELAKEYGAKAYKSLEELLEDKTVDAVSVCVANAFQKEITIKALESGKDVLCEKPMAITLEDSLEMVECAKRNHKRLLIGQNQRLTPAHKKAKELISSGEMGRVITFSTMFCHGGPETWCVDKSSNTWFFKKNTAAFGSMADLGIHKIDLMRYLLGNDIEYVYSEMRTLDKTFEDGTRIEVDDNSVEILTFKNGAFGTVTTSWTCYGTEYNQTNIFCSKGVLKLYTDPDYSLIIDYKDGREDKFALDKIQTNSEQTNSGVIDEFVSALLENRPSVLDASDIIGSMRAVFACEKSYKNKREERVL